MPKFNLRSITHQFSRGLALSLIALIVSATFIISARGAKSDLPSGGYEGDVSSRTEAGKGSVGIADWVLIGRFLAGDDTAQNGGEFQRADCAPKETKGDGLITMADWVQAGRYATGVDPLVAAGGPKAPADNRTTKPEAVGDLKIINTSQTATSVTLSITYEAKGTESAFGLSLAYDQTILDNPVITLGSGAVGASLIPNTTQAGKIGVILGYLGNQTFAAGVRQLFTVTFDIKKVGVTTQVTFANSPVPSSVVDGGEEVALVIAAPGSSVTIAVNNPLPTLTSISPTSMFATSAAFTLTVNGTNFNNNSIVRWNGTDRVTTFVSATQLQAAITAADILSAGAAAVTVFNPLPGGGTTSSATFTIIPPNPVPVATSLAPSSIASGSSQFTLAVNGSSFVNGAVIRWNGADRVTTFVSATQVTAVIPATDVVNAGTAKVRVFNPAVGGGLSAELDFTIIQTNPLPTLTSINPAPVIVGGAAFTLMVNGTNFVSASKVRLNGADRVTTFVSGTQLNAAITAADIANVGTADITVFSPTPGGGTTNTIQLAIQNPAPVLTTLNPTSLLVGANNLTLTLTGSSFRPNSVVRVNGADRVTSFVSDTQLSATLLAADVAAAGILKVTVFTPTPGGGLSSEASLTVNNPVPVIASLNPTSTFNTLPAFTLMVNGSNFINGSIVRWNGTDRVTTFVSSTKLTAAITAADIANVATAAVTVFNPTPGGGPSNTVNFVIEKLTGYEADVAPRPTGNNDGTVTVADWVQVGRFFIGLDTFTNASEFQRADCAPKATKGDGQISITDWVQAGRYAAGLDAVVVAGGPTGPVAQPLLAPELATREAQPRTLRAVNANFQRDQLGTLQIELDGQGNENAFAFSLNFDPQVMSFADAVSGNDAKGAALTINRNEAANGRIGIAFAMPVGNAIAAGTRSVLNVRFIPNAGAGETTSLVSFSDALINRQMSDAAANLLATAQYTSATVNISGRAVANVIAASYVGGELAADSIASAFGSSLATTTEAITSATLPTTLGGTNIKVLDSKGIERVASLFFVSPSQVNYQIPADTATGLATITITNRDGVTARGLLNVARVAPGVFSADSTGSGVAAANIVYVKSDGKQSWDSAAHYDTAQSRFVANPIDVSADPAFLILYGTGIKNRSALATAKITVDSLELPVEYAGAQGNYSGLDQVNVKLPASLAGRGEVKVELSVDGRIANAVKVTIK